MKPFYVSLLFVVRSDKKRRCCSSCNIASSTGMILYWVYYYAQYALVSSDYRHAAGDNTLAFYWTLWMCMDWECICWVYTRPATPPFCCFFPQTDSRWNKKFGSFDQTVWSFISMHISRRTHTFEAPSSLLFNSYLFLCFLMGWKHCK